jgi:hypothetical protein
MNLPGEAYLFNLSLLALTFAAVSVLVMLMRQTMGGKLANYDIHLVTNYVAQGFVVAVGAILPSMLADLAIPPTTVWIVASALVAILLAVCRVFLIRQRKKATTGAPPPFLMFVYIFQWMLVALLVANAAVPGLRGVGLFEAALSLFLAVVMLAFVRRIASLLGDQPGDDWDPKKA